MAKNMRKCRIIGQYCCRRMNIHAVAGMPPSAQGIALMRRRASDGAVSRSAWRFLANARHRLSPRHARHDDGDEVGRAEDLRLAWRERDETLSGRRRAPLSRPLYYQAVVDMTRRLMGTAVTPLVISAAGASFESRNRWRQRHAMPWVSGMEYRRRMRDKRFAARFTPRLHILGFSQAASCH